MTKDNQVEYTNPVLTAFRNACKHSKSPRVLELGTRRSILNRPTMHFEYVPHAREFLGIDLEIGLDVDIIGDIHRLSEIVGKESFDVIISCSTFEHLKYPHLAAHEIMKTLTIGGLLFIQTHHEFILVDSPADYFRYTKEGLSGLFGTKNGFTVKGVNYEFPARLVSERVPEISSVDVYINTTLFGQKNRKTPSKYIYEFDYQTIA